VLVPEIASWTDLHMWKKKLEKNKALIQLIKLKRRYEEYPQVY
jgi:hypothetical protein